MGSLVVGATPWIVGSVTALKTAARLASLHSRPFQIVEFRVDLMDAPVDEILHVAKDSEKAGIPVLWTVRSKMEGGQWAGDDESRLEAYRRALPVVSAVDVEMCSAIFPEVVRSAKRARKTVVGSFHDFRETPPLAALQDLVKLARSAGAQIPKLATQLRHPADAIVLYELLRDCQQGPLCVIGLGPWGAATRIGLPCAGSCLAYGFVDRSAAPGQFSCYELKRLLGRWHPGFEKEQAEG